MPSRRLAVFSGVAMRERDIPATCRHRRQRVVAQPDGSRRQCCLDCGATIAKLAPALPRLRTDDELRVEAERRQRRREIGLPLNAETP